MKQRKSAARPQARASSAVSPDLAPGASNAQQQEALRQRTSGASQDSGGWLDFATEGLRNLKFDGMIDRFQQASAMQEAVRGGADPGSFGLEEEDYRLRNIAEMTDVATEVEGKVDHPAAHSLASANFWFYTLFENRGGAFKDMDMDRYREIAAMPGAEAADVLPEFEAETFRRSGDEDTVRFGNALPAANRRDLFEAHNKFLTPKKRD